jgi:hypothetical protein
MKKNNFLFLGCYALICFCLVLNSVSALQIINQSSFDINKTVGKDSYITFILKNDDPVNKRVNLTFDTNSFIVMPKINELLSGQSVEVTATVYSDNTVNSDARIKGYYFADTGISDKTSEVIISSSGGVDKCSFSVYQGDTVKWIHNDATREVKLWNADTNTIEQVIGGGQNFSKKFDFPTRFTYYLTKYIDTNKVTQNCDISVLSTQGYINDPNTDAIIHINSNPKYENTNLSINIFETNYNITIGSESDGVLLIKTNGNRIAKNVHLSAGEYTNWFKFSANNFDLDSQQTKSITYTIKPQLTNTNQTAKTHNIQLVIEGNFNNVYQNFSVYIPYAVIDSNNSAHTLTPLEFLQFCTDYPTSEYCVREKQIIYRDINGSNNEFNVTYSEEQVRQLNAFTFEMYELFNDKFDNTSARMDTIENITLDSKNNTEVAKEAAVESKKSNQDLYDMYVFTLILIIFGGLCIIGYKIYLNLRAKKGFQSKSYKY